MFFSSLPASGDKVTSSSPFATPSVTALTGSLTSNVVDAWTAGSAPLPADASVIIV